MKFNNPSQMQRGNSRRDSDVGQRGSAIVISLFVLALITVFVALALSRSSAEAAATGNETAEGKTFYAAQGSLEMMTRNFNKKFEVNLKPGTADFDDVRNADVPGLSTSVGGRYSFTQEVLQTSNNVPVVLSGGPFSGLYAKRDNWRLRTTATEDDGVQVQLTRNILNNLVPIFQFGIFYDDDLEFHPGPRFDFGGRVHSNGSLFLQADTGLYFSSKVTAANFIYTDTSKNGSPWTNWDDNVFVKNASGTYVQLENNMGSVLASPVNGAPVVSTPAPTIPLPTAYDSATWATNKALFDGNLQANVKSLQLPIKLNSDNTAQNLDLVEVIKRGKSVGSLWNDGTGSVATPSIIPVTAAKTDDAITAAERYFNKTGIRVSLADSKSKLPGCVTSLNVAVSGPCGVRLDGDAGGQTAGGSSHVGYQPLLMVGTPIYQATQVNGNRFYTAGKETWIKVETVIYNATTEVYDTQDITQDILSLGVTEPAPYVTNSAGTSTFAAVQDANYLTGSPLAVNTDSRSVIKLQRFAIAGPDIPNTTGAAARSTFASNSVWNGNRFNFVNRGTISATVGANRCTTAGPLPADEVDGGIPSGFALEDKTAMKTLWVAGVSDVSPATNRKYLCIVPFPIEMFDTREGLFNDSTGVFNPTSTTAPGYGSNVPYAGVMSMVDIDVANLKTFLDGGFNSNMPVTTPYYIANLHVLRGNDIPQPLNSAPKSGGWVFYVSDRRGDYDFDGEYDMEDVYGNNGTLQTGEDTNKNGTLQRDIVNEAPPYTGTGSNLSPDIAAFFEHKFYRRGVRLINAQTIPGIYDTTTPANSKGFTAATENGIYVLGNYNATGITSVGTPTPSSNYLPADTTSLDIPASITSDAVTILSNSWNDSESFSVPFDYTQRRASDTYMRFAMLSGDTLTSLSDVVANQGGNDVNMNGGVHNFKRFLEDWGSSRLSYSGSLINLFNSHNNNGTYKSGGTHVYSPPDRNWVFDATFLDINRLPPGTPYFQYAQTTGFQRTND